MRRAGLLNLEERIMDRSRLLLSRVVSYGALVSIVSAVVVSCGDSSAPKSDPANQAAYDRAGAAAPEATDRETRASRVAYTAEGAGEATITPAAIPDETRSIIRRARLELSVADTDDAAGEITALAERLGGYVGDLTARRRDELLFYDLTIRLPTARYGEAMTALKGMATRVESETRSTEDVTDQIVDLGARLETLRGVETELRALLAESRRQGRDVAAIMEIYRQLTDIRTQIEQLEARLANLERETALSAIQVTLVPDAAARPILGDAWRPGETVREAFAMLVGVLQGLGDLAIFAAVFLLPLVALVAVPFLILGGRALRRRGA